MKTSVALIGFMGTGKSAVGKALAQKLGKGLIVLDDIIIVKAGKSIPDIFGQDGEPRFRELEVEVVCEVANKKNAVIDCGGGVVLNTVNVERLKKESVIVCLTAPVEVILKRTPGDSRPLLPKENREQYIRNILDYRLPLYTKAADITVDTSRLDVNGVVAEIIKKLGEYENYYK
ncbi:MAG: shikimate kinase [Dehalococcoidales bacterium]|nr:shikimate kinase [Dehalococcoidales bacterium]